MVSVLGVLAVAEIDLSASRKLVGILPVPLQVTTNNAGIKDTDGVRCYIIFLSEEAI